MGTLANPNRLTQEQTWAFLKAMENKDNQEYITQRHLTQKQIAAFISEQLDFTVTDNQVEQAAKTIKFQLPRTCTPKNSKVGDVLRAQVADLQNKVIVLMQTVEELKTKAREQAAEIARCRGLVHHLYHEWETTPPPGVTIPTAAALPLVSSNSK